MTFPGATSGKKLEMVSLAAPPGLRFWDGVSDQFVGSGLVVTAYPAGGTGLRKQQAIVNAAAVYILPSLPSLRRFENEVVDERGSEGAGVSRRELQVEFYDDEGRFLPGLLRMPERHAGLAGLWCGSPLTHLSFGSPLSGLEKAIPLFSAPGRPVPAGMAVIRAQLWDVANERAAAWALVEAMPPGQDPVMGVADDQGQLTLIFPYPAPQPSLFGSSPLGSPLSSPLGAESWPIPLRAYYSALAGPDVCAILQQRPAHLWSSLSPAVALSTATLFYGKEASLSSEGATRPSTLMITG